MAQASKGCFYKADVRIQSGLFHEQTILYTQTLRIRFFFVIFVLVFLRALRGPVFLEFPL